MAIRHVTTLDERLLFTRVPPVILRECTATGLPNENGVKINDPLPRLNASENAQLPLSYRIVPELTMPRQPILGFGAALTESSAYNLFMLKQHQPIEYDELLRRLFAVESVAADNTAITNNVADPATGAGLQLLRVPISACDFNLNGHNFTLADKSPKCGVKSLCKQASATSATSQASSKCPMEIDLTPLRKYVLPMLKDILRVRPQLKLILSSWSAPKWMKTRDTLMGGQLRDDAQTCYGVYLADAAAAIAKELNNPRCVHAITIQNEPGFETQNYPSMTMTPAQETTVANVLRARLNAHQLRDTRIWAHDHNWDRPDRPAESFKLDKKRVIDGAAFHCYDPYGGQVEKQSWLHNQHPDRAIHITECSGGNWAPHFRDNMRWNWQKLYWGGIKHWAQSVLHWNLALDTSNGPLNGAYDGCRGVVTIDTKKAMSTSPKNSTLNVAASTVRYEVEWYGMAHAARYLPEQAHYIDTSITPINSSSSSSSSKQHSPCVNDGELQVVTYVGVDSTEMIIMNRCDKQSIAAHVVIGNYSGYVRLPPDSLTTLVWPIPSFKRVNPSNSNNHYNATTNVTPTTSPVNTNRYKSIKAKLRQWLTKKR
ncbi:glycoside hydrolase superfamily [Syncephalis plumigaleata]|nr:glycoside hydrolase superfamily [Syncephalis plumigaleata]